jgi:hypothetical protein
MAACTRGHEDVLHTLTVIVSQDDESR